MVPRGNMRRLAQQKGVLLLGSWGHPAREEEESKHRRGGEDKESEAGQRGTREEDAGPKRRESRRHHRGDSGSKDRGRGGDRGSRGQGERCYYILDRCYSHATLQEERG
ncbi:hypothetical protein NDU88_010640 [Pleurodeles waltl]|uniref:Uncharacterized protein n=1 Tax=Pleurodeles waltl TaxID=8319 RepID=A0AAV7S1E1_PLEWA|nr:hypothetical protein NDU88_010640 [Pleurodeles waltl]